MSSLLGHGDSLAPSHSLRHSPLMDRALGRLRVRGEEADGAEVAAPRRLLARVDGAQRGMHLLLQLRFFVREHAVQVERLAQQAGQHGGLDVDLDEGGDDGGEAARVGDGSGGVEIGRLLQIRRRRRRK